MFRVVLIVLLSFQVIILFLLFYPSRYQLWGWCPILDTTFVQQVVQYGFHTFPYLVFNSAIWVGCSLFIITSFVVSIFLVTFVILSRQLGMFMRGFPGEYCRIHYNSNSLWDPGFTLLYFGTRTWIPTAGMWFLQHSGFFQVKGLAWGVQPATWVLRCFPAEVLVWGRQLMAMSGSGIAIGQPR